MYPRRLGAVVNVYDPSGSGQVIGTQEVGPGITAVQPDGWYADAAGVWHPPGESAPAAPSGGGSGFDSGIRPAGGGGGVAPGVQGDVIEGEGGDVVCPDDHDNCHRMVLREGHCEGALIQVLSAEGPGCDAPGGGEGFAVSRLSASPQLIAGVPNWALYLGLAAGAYFLFVR